MVFGHGGLKVGRGQMFGVRLVGAPLHEQAVTNAAEQAPNQHAWGSAEAAAVVIVGNVQALVQTVFNAAKTSPVQLEPSLGVKLVGSGAGEQGDFFILTTFGLAQQAGGLGGQRKANLLRGDRPRHKGAALQALLVFLQGAVLRGRRLPRGENPPGERGAVSGWSHAPWVGCLWR